MRRALLLAACMGCGASTGATEQTAADRAGEPEAAPSMECVPVAASDVATEHMQFAWLLSEQSFELADPVPPPGDSDTQTVQEWTGGPLRQWLEQKNELVEAARAELNLAAEEGQAQRVMAGGLVGLMYEDVARVLLRVPMPQELRDEPEIATVFQDVIDAQARPYLGYAHRAYDACAQNARQDEGYSHWGHWCAARESRLPLTREEGMEEGTTVEVIPPP